MIKKYSIGVFVLAISSAIYCLLGIKFLSGINTFNHDNYNWTFAAFSHWSNSLKNGSIPLYDFFSNLGIPFTPLVVQLRFLDPVDLIFSVSAIHFSNNVASIFNVRFVFLIILNAYGVILFINLFIKENISKYLTVLIVLLSSFVLSSFSQTGFLLVFQWCGFLGYAICGIFKSNSNQRYVLLSVLIISTSLQGYSYAGIALIAIIYGLLWLKNRNIYINKKWLFLILFLIPALPSIFLFSEKSNFMFPAREPLVIERAGTKIYQYSQFEPKSTSLTKSDLVQNYAVLRQIGVFGKPIDFVSLFSPAYNANVIKGDKNIQGMNEGYFYYGFLTLFFLPIGFIYYFRDKTRLSYVFLLTLLFYLGPDFYFHTFIYLIFPPIWVFRHSTLINLFIQSFLILFIVKGFDLVFSAANNKIHNKNTFDLDQLSINCFGISIGVIFSVAVYLAITIPQFEISLFQALCFLAMLLLFLSLKFNIAIRFLKLIFIGMVAINGVQLAYEFTRSNMLYSQPVQFEKVAMKSSEEILDAVVNRPVKLHGGCYYGESTQVVRFPSLVQYERSIYSPPVARNSDDVINHCISLQSEEEVKKNDRWNVLMVYNQYFKDVLNPDDFLQERKKFILPEAADRAKVIAVTSNSIEFGDIGPGMIKTNLYYDKDWLALCDGVKVKIDKAELVAVDVQNNCRRLELKYYPRLFVLSMYAVFFYYLTIVVLLIYLYARRK